MDSVIRLSSLCIVATIFAAGDSLGQTPQPFPRPGDSGQQQRPAPPAQPQRPAPAAAAPAAPSAVAAKPQPAADPNRPSAVTTYFPVYPSAQMIGSYDAGRGQRYYLFGTTSPFNDIVTYYRTQLDEKGTLVFREPPTHMFEVGRFREETMAFPPGVTVKDWTWGGSQGYPNPKLGAQPARFPTIIMIVPPPVPPPAGTPQQK
jgi:hypothetical protein